MTIGSQARARKSITLSQDQAASRNSFENSPVRLSPKTTVENSIIISASRKLGIARPRYETKRNELLAMALFVVCGPGQHEVSELHDWRAPFTSSSQVPSPADPPRAVG